MKTRKELLKELALMSIHLTPPIHWPKYGEQMVISLSNIHADVLGLASDELLTVRTYGGKYCIEREKFTIKTKENTPCPIKPSNCFSASPAC